MEGYVDGGIVCGVMRGGMHVAGWWGDCPPIVLQIRGNLLAIVTPCLFTGQRAERGDFSSAEPMTSKFFQNHSLWVSRLPFYSSLSFLAVSLLCSRCSAQSAPARYSIVSFRDSTCAYCGASDTAYNAGSLVLHFFPFYLGE